MIRHPATVPVACPECGAKVPLPVIQTLIIGDTATIRIDGEALEAHMVVCAAERILEGE